MEENTDIRLTESETFAKDESSSYRSLDEVEVKLTSIWQEILGVKGIKNTDNFFELGGHSLLAIQLISTIRNYFQIEISLEDIFNRSTFSEMADKINELISVKFR